ncbi:MAG: hypothetical protein AABZ84_04230 [Pseudomonadota bacterium]
MIFKRRGVYALLFISALALTGCPGGDENTVQSGLVLHFAEVHGETLPGGVPLDATGVQNSAAVHGGYDQAQLEHHDIRDKNGRFLSLYRAYAVLDRLELIPCTSLTQLPRRVLDTLIGTAEAHAGHGTEPVGGRALDKPNVIDIVTQDGFILPLGDAAVAPGRYCGLRVSLVRLAGDAYGKPVFATASNDDPTTSPEVPDLAGRIFSIKADYCAEVDGVGECIRRVKVDADDDALNEPAVRTLDFDRPLEINADLREAYIAVGIAYGDWLQDVDITLLVSDIAERQKVLDNIAASLHIYSHGLGELPANIAQ